MKVHRRIRNLVVLLSVAVVTVPAIAQTNVSKAQNKLLAKRAAEADCFRKLAEAVYGLQLTSDTTVRDFVTESDIIKTSVDAFVKGVKLGTPRYYEDGVCEVDAEVTVAKIVRHLKAVYSAHYEGNIVTSSDFEKITDTVKTDVIRVTGSGAPRPELPPGLPIGAEGMIEPLPLNYSAPMSVPGIWKTVGPQARLMAQRAARVDAMRKLLEQIKGLRLTSDTLVRDFVTESDEITTRAKGIVIGATEVSRYLHNDELIVEVTMEVPVEKIITRIKELHTQHYHGNKVTTTDITNVKKTIQRDMIRATGAGVPPARFVSQAQAAGYQTPMWFSERISATGQGTDEAIDTAQGRLRAARAAELDAKRRLAEQVYGLEVESGTTVQDFITQYDQITIQVAAVLTGSVVGEASFANGVATVSVSLPAAEVWSVINDQILIIKRRG